MQYEKHHALWHCTRWLQHAYGFAHAIAYQSPPLPEGYALMIDSDYLWFHWVSYECEVSMAYADILSAYLGAIAHAQTREERGC
jgi:hypothetical protein